MKKLYILCLTAAFVFLLIQPGITIAQDDKSQVTKTEVENLIEEKLNEERPLTKEELTKAILEMKDEKISSLEGNLSSVLNTAGIVVAVISLFLATVIAIVGGLVKRNIDDKLTEIENKEREISNTYNDVKTKSDNINELYQQMKDFVDTLDKTKKKLDINENLLEKREVEFDELRKYVGAIEDLANSSILVNQFLEEKNQAINIIEETRSLLKRPQKHQDFVVLKLSQKLGMQNELKDLDSITSHLEHILGDLNEEEESLWRKIQRVNNVEELYINNDEDSMTLHEEIESNIADWKEVLGNIIIIKEHWESNLKLNPPKVDHKE